MTILRSLLSGVAVYLAVATVAGVHGCATVEITAEPTPCADGGVLDPVACVAAHTKSGARLRVRYLVGDDGAEAFLGWRDTALDVDCYWATAADGKTRCLPIVAGSGSAGVYYLDADCADGLVTTPACSTAPLKYGATSETMACGIVRRIYAVGAGPVEVANPYALQYGDCVPSALQPGYVAHLLGAEVEPANFVAGVEATE